MSIFRFSWLREGARQGLTIPAADGAFVKTDYDLVKQTGFVGFQAATDHDWMTDRAALDGILRTRKDEIIGKRGNAPVIVIVNGFEFDPSAAMPKKPNPGDIKNSDNPHGRIFHFTPLNEKDAEPGHSASWPLGIGAANGDEGADGVVVAFGWQSDPDFWKSINDKGGQFYIDAYHWGAMAANALAEVLRSIVSQWDVDISIVAHSLGTHVTTFAIQQLELMRDKATLKAIDRVVFLAGAERRNMARSVIDNLSLHINPDEGPRFYNIANTDDEIVRFLARNFSPGAGPCLGSDGIGPVDDPRRCIDVNLNRSAFKHWAKANLKSADVVSDAQFARPPMQDPLRFDHLDHWVCYTHPGNMAVIQQFLLGGQSTSLTALRAKNIPEGV